MTSIQLNEWLENATQIVGQDIVYDAATFAALNLQEFNKKHWSENDKKLLSGVPLESVIRESTLPLLLKGESASQLFASLQGVTNRQRVIDIVQNGQRKTMISSFKPNGGKERSLGTSYQKMRPICNDAILGLVEKRRAIAFTEDVMFQSNQMEKITTSPLVWTTKTNAPKGRTCLHASKGSVNFPSLNDSIDRAKSDKLYPPQTLPTLPDIAELACQQREQYPDEPLSGATVDISSAYNQVPQTVDSAMTHGTRLKVDDGIGGYIMIIIIYLVAIFGFSTAGDIYCQCAQAIDEIHNMGLSTKRSRTYIDDGLLISPRRLIDQSVAEYIIPAEKLFGKVGVINKDKVEIWPSQLQGIGWHFDFISWTVKPKEKCMAKMLYCLFVRIPLGAVTVDEKEMEIVTGVLGWYAAGLPAGKSYLTSLYSCQHHVSRTSRRIKLTVEANADLMWWRALIIVAYAYPNAISASIDSIRRNKAATWFFRSDASSLIGGGAYVSTTMGGDAIDEFDGEAIRWTREEKMIFQQTGVSINVLEYYVVVYYVMLWGEKFRNSTIHVECDNTSAVNWIVKSRAGHSPAADALSKLFSLFCLKTNITIICTHIQGVNNTIADFRSRDLSYLAQDADEELASGNLSMTCTRQELCRKLLKLSVVEPGMMHGHRALQLLTRLQ
jgi:hypothetical protein